MKPAIPSREELVQLYESESDDRIAEQFHVSAATVRRWRRDYLIPSKNRGPRPAMRRIHKVPDADVIRVAAESLNITDLLRNLGLSFTGTSHRTMKHRLTRLQVNTSHFGKRKPVLGHQGRAQAPEAYLVQGKRISSDVKRRLIRAGLLHEACEKCGGGPEWLGERLVLQIDHVDGDPLNNSRENLRLLCPNCHSQTRTFAGRNVGK